MTNLPNLQFGNQNPGMQTNNIMNGTSNLFQNTQSAQQFFMQPIGNIYNLNSSSDVSNMPIGSGISLGICLPEAVMYLKSMQQNGPALLGYKLSPLETIRSNSNSNSPSSSDGSLEKINQMFSKFDDKLNHMQEDINKLYSNINTNSSNTGEKKWEI